MENEKRKKFIEQFAVQVEKIAQNKFSEESEQMKPSIGEIVDGYKSFIQDLGGGFLEIAENYNECLQIAKDNELIGDAKLKARIKDFSSSKTNSDIKILDDVFGMELVTATEFEKEVLMLFSHLVFNIDKDKKYNKTTGYVAYHCMGDYSPKEGDLQEKIKQIVKQTKTKEYKYSKSEPNYNDKKNLVPIFSVLPEYISNPNDLKELSRVLGEMIDYIKFIGVSKENIPFIEFHFLTTEKEQEALRGAKANHANYKKVNQRLIERYFNEGTLIRGINAPWKFIGTKNGLELQDFYETLLENWTFLKDEIIEKRISGKEIRDKETTSKFDVLSAAQFPFLRKYLDGSHEYPEDENAEKWGLLKALIIANRIDKTEKTQSIEDGLTIGVDQIWSK